MKITGIIAEYNPFHRGHQYQIRQVRERFGSDYIIAVISGDFVQRGAPALTDKYTRAQMALLGGVDLVLELPAVYATASAETFARGGIQTLAATGIVDSVAFGMEQADSDTLTALSKLLLQEPAWYRQRLREGLGAGLSFPAARSNALPEYADFLASPNNILALEYAKAIWAYAPWMKPLPIERQGSGYHQQELGDRLPSGGAIRSFLKGYALSRETSSFPGDPSFPETSPFRKTSLLAQAVPESSLSLLADYVQEAAFLYEEDLSLPLSCALIGQTQESLLACSDMNSSLAGRILRFKDDCLSFPGFCELLKTRDLTYARISRTLLHLLLHITNELMDWAGQAPYLRVLGFRKSAASLLGRMETEGTAPLITSLSRAWSDTPVSPSDEGQRPLRDKPQSLLSPEGLSLLRADLAASELYRALLVHRTGRPWPNEFRRRLLTVD